MNERPTVVPGLALALVVLLTVSSAGRGQGAARPHVVIPKAAEVSKVTFRATERFPGGPFELTLTKPEEFGPLLACLRDVGWDYAKSGDTKVIRFAPLAVISVSRRDKGSLSFPVVGEGIVIAKDRYWPIDRQKLEAAVKPVRDPAK